MSDKDIIESYDPDKGEQLNRFELWVHDSIIKLSIYSCNHLRHHEKVERRLFAIFLAILAGVVTLIGKAFF